MRYVTKYTSLLLFNSFLLASFVSVPVFSQQMVFESDEDGNMAMLAIPGGLLIVQGEEARVERRIVPSATDETPDIQEGDQIIFLNGTRIETTSHLRELFEPIEVGAEVKVGIQRGENKMIRAFAKAEMQNSYSSNEGGRVMRFEMGGPEGGAMEGLENRGMWPAGFIVGEKDGQVIVGGSMPLPNKAEALADVKAGDTIVSLNGTEITSVEQLNSEYESIAVGDDVTVEVKNEDGTEKLLFKKPEPPQMRMQVRRNE